MVKITPWNVVQLVVGKINHFKWSVTTESVFFLRREGETKLHRVRYNRWHLFERAKCWPNPIGNCMGLPGGMHHDMFFCFLYHFQTGDTKMLQLLSELRKSEQEAISFCFKLSSKEVACEIRLTKNYYPSESFEWVQMPVSRFITEQMKTELQTWCVLYPIARGLPDEIKNFPMINNKLV